MSSGIEKLEEVRQYVQENISEMPYWLYSNLTDSIDRASEVLEAELKAKDERIAELEAKLKPKTCDGCEYEDDKVGGFCYVFHTSCSREPTPDHYTPRKEE